jgi:hypothetical protein
MDYVTKFPAEMFPVVRDKSSIWPMGDSHRFA